jgi:hypothetical protein
MPTHHAFDDGAVVASIFAGGSSASEVKSLLTQVASVLPGFDVGTEPKVASQLRPVAVAAAASVAAFASAFYVTGDLLVANAAGAVPALGALGYATEVVSTRASKLLAAVAEGLLPRPAKRHVPPSKPRDADPAATGRRRRPSDGSYPLALDTFLVGPTVTIGVVAPQAGAASGATATNTRNVPAVLTERIGPMIGPVVGAAEKIHLPAADAHAGVALIGQPGSGKSAVLRAIWGWNCLERVAPSGLERWPGARNATVAFESKGDGADLYRRWADAAGDKTVMVEVADPSSWSIDVFAVPGSASERASWFVNAMVYAFGDGSIQDRSFETLQSVLTAGLAIPDDVATEAGLAPGRSPLWYAFVLLGGHGDQKGQALAAAVAVAAVAAEAGANEHALGDGGPGPDSASTDLGVASEKLSPLYATAGGKVSDAQRRNLTEAPRNKVGQLLGLESWWAPDRRRVTWDQVLDGHRSIVVNTGVSTSGHLVDERLCSQMSALLMYGLKSAIQRRCSGWQDRGQSVTVFADELALVAGASPEVITWLRNQGRSFGVRPIFATQYPEQLAREVRTAFMSFGTLVAFAQQNAMVVTEIVATGR